MSDKEKYKLSKVVLISFFIIWIVTSIIIHIYNIYSPDTAFFMTVLYLLIQNHNQECKYKVVSIPRYQDALNLIDIAFISTTMWIMLAGLLVVIPLYFIMILFIIICISYIWIIKHYKNKSEQESKIIKK